MKTYAEARALAGTSEVCSYASGRTRFLTWDIDADGAVLAEIYGTVVVRFYPDHVEVRTAGHPTPSTFDAISTALVGHANRYNVAGTVSRVPYVFGQRMTEPTVLDYDGRRVGALDLNDQLSPLADPRRAALDVVDVGQDAEGYRVTVRDLTYDRRERTTTIRKLAAAYVGAPWAITRVVHRCGADHGHAEEPQTTILVKTEA